MSCAQQSVVKQAVRHKACHDRKTHVKKLQPGDKVLVLLPSRDDKLLMTWEGPFTVTQSVGFVSTDFS